MPGVLELCFFKYVPVLKCCLMLMWSAPEISKASWIIRITSLASNTVVLLLPKMNEKFRCKLMLLLIQLRAWRIIIIYSTNRGNCKNQESGSCIKCQGDNRSPYMAVGMCLDVNARTGQCLQECSLPVWHVGKRNSPFMLFCVRHPLNSGQMRACAGGRTTCCHPKAHSPGQKLWKRERRLRLWAVPLSSCPHKWSCALQSWNLLSSPWLEH